MNKSVQTQVYKRRIHEITALYDVACHALVALTLMVVESKPQEKDLIVNMTVNLINKSNE